MTPRETDVLVIGSGIAGLSFALKVAAAARVTIVTKKHRSHSNTNYAQGGIAAVMSPADSFEAHVADTIEAGAGLCHEDAVRDLVREGPDRVRELMAWGAEFTRQRDGSLSLGKEGGHSARRIVHAADLTGREIERALLEAAEAEPNIVILEDHAALDLLPATAGAPEAAGASADLCAGAWILNVIDGTVFPCQARFTLLATGGFGRIYRHTTNPEIATGDGVAMAHRAGATVANLEFVQFHPTALFPAEGRAVLISEAVRGEGAVLRTMDGELVVRSHPMGSLATRDVVAREIDRVLKESGDPHVWLDLSPISADIIAERFPYIMARCEEHGIDILNEPVPVVPAAHYACGGVLSDHGGRTDLDGLYVAGEVACTGVHGANRLASNSLLEAVVYSHRAAEDVVQRLAQERTTVAAPGSRAFGTESPDLVHWQSLAHALRDLMWEDAGIVRSDARLGRAETSIREIRVQIRERAAREVANETALQVQNMADTALLIVRSARRRMESRGLHFNTDHPEPVESQRVDTLIGPETGVG